MTGRGADGPAANLARRAPRVAVDWTKCFGYEQLIAEEIEHYSAIEVTDELKEGGIAANPAWEGWYRFLSSTWETDFGGEIVAAARRFASPRLLSLGCGYGGFEIAIARRLGAGSRVLALDLNEALFRRAREEVARDGLDVTFQAIDLNFVELEPGSFDVVFAHASLHHLLNFEQLFEQVHRALVDEGTLVVLDIIGKTQVLFWPENVRFATELVANMPERYREGVVVEARALFPGYIDGADQSGMEGIRQEELEEQLARWFQPRRSHRYNSFVRLICTQPSLVPRFDPDDADDRAYLERLYRLDLEQIETGALRATELFAVFDKRPAQEVPSLVPLSEAEAGTPAVSVLLTCEGTANDLRRCVASLVAQTRPAAAIVLLEVGEDPELAAVARELVAGHPGMRWVPRSEVLDAKGRVDWERVLADVGSELVAHLDGRDTWYPIRLADLVALLSQTPEACLAYSQALLVDDRGRRTARAGGSDVVGASLGAAWPSDVPPGALPRSTALVRRSCLRTAGHGGTGPVADLWQLLEPGRPVVFDARPLGMLRADAAGPLGQPALPEPSPEAQRPAAEPRRATAPGSVRRLLHRLLGISARGAAGS